MFNALLWHAEGGTRAQAHRHTIVGDKTSACPCGQVDDHIRVLSNVLDCFFVEVKFHGRGSSLHLSDVNVSSNSSKLIRLQSAFCDLLRSNRYDRVCRVSE